MLFRSKSSDSNTTRTPSSAGHVERTVGAAIRLLTHTSTIRLETVAFDGATFLKLHPRNQ